MSTAQTMLYFREWSRVRDVLKTKGLPCGDVERHNFHLKALGTRKSSKGRPRQGARRLQGHN